MTDDDLARALRRMDPAETPLDAPLPLDAERRLRQILDRPPVRRRRPALAWTSAAAAVVVILTIVTGVLWMPGTSASALTPKPLVYTAVPSGTGAAEVIAQAQERLAAGDGEVARSAARCRSAGTSAPHPTGPRRRCSGANGWTCGGTRTSPDRW